jgi:hypothetical protein
MNLLVGGMEAESGHAGPVPVHQSSKPPCTARRLDQTRSAPKLSIAEKKSA